MSKSDKYWSKHIGMKPKEKNRLNFQTIEERRAKVTFQEFEQMDNVDKIEFFLIAMDYTTLPKKNFRICPSNTHRIT